MVQREYVSLGAGTHDIDYLKAPSRNRASDRLVADAKSLAVPMASAPYFIIIQNVFRVEFSFT